MQMRVALLLLNTLGQALPLHYRLIPFQDLASFIIQSFLISLVCSGIPPVSQGLQHFLSKSLWGEGIQPEEREIATGYADTSLLNSRKKANICLSRHSLIPLMAPSGVFPYES